MIIEVYFLTQIMEKINNKKSVILYTGIFLIFLVIFSLTGTFLFLLLPKSISVLFSMIVVVIISVIIFRNLKFFEFENSMQFISIKQSYFWKINTQLRPIEFPNTTLESFSIYKVLFVTSIILIIKSSSEKNKKLYCTTIGLSNKQILELKKIA